MLWMDTQAGPLVFTSVLQALIFYHVWMDTQAGPLVSTQCPASTDLLSCLDGQTGWSTSVH